MSPTGFRLRLRSGRRRIAVIAAIVCLCGAVVVAHSAIGEGHMGDGMMMCLAIVVATAAAVTALGMPPADLMRFPAPFSRQASDKLETPPVAPVVPRSRAGPALLQVFLR